MIGYRKLLQIGSAVTVVFLLLNMLALRDTPHTSLKTALGILYIVFMVVLFVLLLLNRYRP